MMKAGTLRAAALVALLQGFTHAVTIFSAEPQSVSEKVVVATMKGTHFYIAGMRRSYWDPYFGYSLMAAATIFAEAVLLWILAGMAARDAHGVRPILWLLLALNLSHAAAALLWLFPIDLLFSGAVAILLLIAALAGRAKRAIGSQE